MTTFLFIFHLIYLSFQYACFGFDETETSFVCSNNGDCVGDDVCECDDGYVGEVCAFRGCYNLLLSNPQVCSGHGECSVLGTCICEEGYVEDDCSQHVCAGFYPSQSGVCLDKGTCSEANKCTCDSGFYGSNCEYFDCTGNQCQSIMGQDRVIQPNYVFNPDSGGSVSFIFTAYQVYPRLRPDEEVDCRYVFDSEGYKKIGKGATCQWKATNSHEFVVYLGEAYDTSLGELKVNFFPFESKMGVDPLYASMTPAVAVTSGLQEFWIGLMELLPENLKAPVYQVVGFLKENWYWLLIGGIIFCIITFGSSFVSCFYCCDPKKRRARKNRMKVARIQNRVDEIRDRERDRHTGPRHVGRGPGRRRRRRANSIDDNHLGDAEEGQGLFNPEWMRSVMPKRGRNNPPSNDRRKSKRKSRRANNDVELREQEMLQLAIEASKREGGQVEVNLMDGSSDEDEDMKRAILESKRAAAAKQKKKNVGPSAPGWESVPVDLSTRQPSKPDSDTSTDSDLASDKSDSSVDGGGNVIFSGKNKRNEDSSDGFSSDDDVPILPNKSVKKIVSDKSSSDFSSNDSSSSDDDRSGGGGDKSLDGVIDLDLDDMDDLFDI